MISSTAANNASHWVAQIFMGLTIAVMMAGLLPAAAAADAHALRDGSRRCTGTLETGYGGTIAKRDECGRGVESIKTNRGT